MRNDDTNRRVTIPPNTDDDDQLVSDANLRGVDRDKIDEKEDLLEKTGQTEFEEEEKTRPHFTGEQAAVGTAPDPEQVNRKTVLERAQKEGLYDDASPSNPTELDITDGYDTQPIEDDEDER